MIRNKIKILLVSIVVLPLIIYILYELNSLSTDEKLVDKVFEQQMNLVLRAVNYNTLLSTKEWIKSSSAFMPGDKISGDKIDEFMNDFRFVKGIIISDTALNEYQYFGRKFIRGLRAEILKSIKDNSYIVRRLITRKEAGYDKIESISKEINTRNEFHILCHIVESERGEYYIAAYLVDTREFIQNIFEPVLFEMARDEFVISIFREGEEGIYTSTGLEGEYDFRFKRNLWLLSDFYIGITLRRDNLKELATGRFRRSLYIMIILGIILFVAVYYLFKSIKIEIELAKMKTDFVSNVSHELRTPLSLIRMFAETIEMGRTESAEEAREFGAIIGNESERLTIMINRILDFSKIEAGKKEYHLKRMNLNALIADILHIYSYTLKEKGFKFETDLSDERLEIAADRDAIAEVLVNLIDNAVKYSPDEKYICVRAGKAKSKIFFEIEDRGMGIPEKFQNKIFDKFFRVNNLQFEARGGSGLGLSLVKHIIDSHDATIEVSSKPGNGSLFRVEFKTIIIGKK